MICLIIFNDLDHEIGMIWIKKLVILFWSGSKKRRIFFDLDQKTYKIFLIWTKKESIFFWSGPKIEDIFFDLDQKFVFFFLIWIKKSRYDFWSGSKKRFFFWSGSKNQFFLFGPGSKNIQIWIKDHQRSWDQKMIHCFDPWSTNCGNFKADSLEW